MSTLTVADLPASLRARVEVSQPTSARQEPVAVLTCAHGPACPACVLAAARALVTADASLAGSVPAYTG